MPFAAPHPFYIRKLYGSFSCFLTNVIEGSFSYSGYHVILQDFEHHEALDHNTSRLRTRAVVLCVGEHCAMCACASLRYRTVRSFSCIVRTHEAGLGIIPCE